MEATQLETESRSRVLDTPRLSLTAIRALPRAHPLLSTLLVTIVLMEIVHGIELLALFPLYLADVEHESATLVALTISTYLVVDILTRAPAGWLADHIGRKPVLLAGIALSALPLPIMMQTREQNFFLLLNAVNGVGAGCIWPAIYASIADHYGKGRRGLIFGLVNTVMLGGLASGPISGGLLLGLSGSFAFSFWFCFGLVALAFLVVAVFAHEGGKRADSPQPAVKQGFAFDAQLAILFLIVFCLTFGVAVLVPILAFYGRDVLGLLPQQFALTLALPALATAVALVPFGHWVDRYGRRRPLVVGLAVFAVCLWLSPVSTAPLVVSLGATLGGLGYALAVPAWNALILDRIPHEARGTLLGLVAALQGVGLALGPSVGGILWESASHVAPFMAAAAALSLGALLALFVRDT